MPTLPFRPLLMSLVVLALALRVAAGYAAGQADDDVSEILAADQAWAKAAIDHNGDLFASFMADNYVLLEWEPATAKMPGHWVSRSKKTWVAAVRQGTQQYSAIELHHQSVHLQGSIATVSGEYSQTATKDGKDDSVSGSYVETWIKRNGHWLALNSVFP
jgi:ketosteroid isomerase-like protein